WHLRRISCTRHSRFRCQLAFGLPRLAAKPMDRPPSNTVARRMMRASHRHLKRLAKPAGPRLRPPRGFVIDWRGMKAMTPQGGIAMDIGFIGLGQMGFHMARRLAQAGPPPPPSANPPATP